MQTELKMNATLEQVRHTAINLLARREHSQLELRQKLLRRGYAAELIATVLLQLMQKDLQSEARFVENYVRTRSNKGYGPTRIMAELQQRGISAEFIKTVIDENAVEWLSLARAVWQKRFSKKLPGSSAEKMKQIRFLQYRGFSQEQINAAFTAEVK